MVDKMKNVQDLGHRERVLGQGGSVLLRLRRQALLQLVTRRDGLEIEPGSNHLAVKIGMKLYVIYPVAS